MHIALVHGSVVPPRRYGGTERVVAWLAQGLLELGHRVTLVCPEGSQIEGCTRADAVPQDADLTHYMATPSELLHSHSDSQSVSQAASRARQKPYLVTIHGNGKPGERFLKNTVFLSKRHARNHGSEHFVYNGIRMEDYACDPVREPYLVFLAKASWKVKNLAGSIELARSLDLPLWVMGSRSYPWNLQRKLPSFGGVRYLGMVNDTEKREILRKATALLFPVRWEEPFGLAIIEALASGCAVFGTPYGSLPELVSHDVGGLNSSPEELARIFREFRFSPEASRAHAANNFSHHHMAQAYVRYYEQVLEHGELSGSHPRVREDWNADELLPWGSLV